LTGSWATCADWADLSEADYRRQVSEVRAQLAALPGGNSKLVLFDRYRAEARSFAEMVDAASGDKLQELLPLLVARVEARDRRVVRVVPTEPAAPFFRWAAEDAAEGLPAWGVAPPDGLEPPTRTLGRCRSIH
jgi:hypothetical protein